jgi:hypothetical protein
MYTVVKSDGSQVLCRNQVEAARAIRRAGPGCRFITPSGKEGEVGKKTLRLAKVK